MNKALELPPTIVGRFNAASAAYGYPVYVQLIKLEEDGGFTHGMGQCIFNYTPDFCGGIDVRSVRIDTGREPRHNESWGWDRGICGCSLNDDEPDLKKAAPWMADIYHVPAEVDEDIKDLILRALAATVLAKATISQKAGIFGKDRDDGNVRALLQTITSMSNRMVPWKHRYGNVDSAGYWKEITFDGCQDREFGEVEFFNSNSDNNVVNAWSIMGDEMAQEVGYNEEALASEDWVRTERSGDNNVLEYLTAQCPTVEWCCG